MTAARTTNRVPVGPALVTPGEILEEEFLKPMGLAQSALAERMGVTRMRVSEIVRGKRVITAKSAILLGQALGKSARFWMYLQTTHDLAVAAIKLDQVACVDYGHPLFQPLCFAASLLPSGHTVSFRSAPAAHRPGLEGVESCAWLPPFSWKPPGNGM